MKSNYPWTKFEPAPAGFPFSGVKGLGHENDWGVLGIPDTQYDDAVTTDYAVQFLKENTAKNAQPFFFACGLFRPHLPWYVPQEYFDLYDLDEIVLPKTRKDDLEDLPPGGLSFAKARRKDFETIKDAGKWKQAVRAYLASISCADAHIGKLLDTLDQSPHAKNTIIVLWSDHGWHLGEKQHWHKTTLWEEATRVPLIISAPGFAPGVCDRPVSLLDLYPTLNALAGFDSDPAHDGVSLVPLLQNSDATWARPAVIEFGRGNAAVRSDRYRYIRYRAGGEELYDHQNDPYEWTNLAKQESHAAIKQELVGWITKDWAASAPTKGAFNFDHQKFIWTHKKSGKVTYGKEAK